MMRSWCSKCEKEQVIDIDRELYNSKREQRVEGKCVECHEELCKIMFGDMEMR